jgi:hypothetical protein
MSTVPRPFASFALAAGALVASSLLAGCASLKTVSSEVSTYGEWPDQRPAGSYVIERMPSQQAPAAAAQQQEVEQSAHQALQAAGFVPAQAGAPSDVVVQIGARITRYERAPWDDPLWSSFYGGRYTPRWAYPGWPGPYSPMWAWRMRTETEYQREVGVLIRDRASGQPLYEARARNDGITSGGQPVLTAMFTAALKEFPKVQNEPHDVKVMLP